MHKTIDRVQILQGQQPISARLVLRVGVTVVARHPDVIPDALELVVEAQNVHRIDLGDYGEPETPLRAVALSALSDRLKKFSEPLAPTSSVLDDEREKLDSVGAPLEAGFDVAVRFSPLADPRLGIYQILLFFLVNIVNNKIYFSCFSCVGKYTHTVHKYSSE